MKTATSDMVADLVIRYSAARVCFHAVAFLRGRESRFRAWAGIKREFFKPTQ